MDTQTNAVWNEDEYQAKLKEQIAELTTSVDEPMEAASLKEVFLKAISDLTPWDILKGGLVFAGGISVSFVTGIVLRRNLIPADKLYKWIAMNAGVMLIQSIAAAKTEEYLDAELSKFDEPIEVLFGGEKTDGGSEDGA